MFHNLLDMFIFSSLTVKPQIQSAEIQLCVKLPPQKSIKVLFLICMSFSNSCDKRYHQSPPTHKSDITACHYAILYRVDIWYAYYVIQYFLQTCVGLEGGENSTRYPYIHKLYAFFVFYYLLTWSENRRGSVLRASHVLAEMTVIVPAMETKSKGTFGYLGNSSFTPALSYLPLFRRGERQGQCLRWFQWAGSFSSQNKTLACCNSVENYCRPLLIITFVSSLWACFSECI